MAFTQLSKPHHSDDQSVTLAPSWVIRIQALIARSPNSPQCLLRCHVLALATVHPSRPAHWLPVPVAPRPPPARISSTLAPCRRLSAAPTRGTWPTARRALSHPPYAAQTSAPGWYTYAYSHFVPPSERILSSITRFLATKTDGSREHHAVFFLMLPPLGSC